MNEFNMIGKALQAIDIQQSSNGKDYGKLVCSVKKQFKNKDGEIESENFQFTLFKNCLDEIDGEIKEGTPIIIKGRVQANNFDKDGKLFYGTSLIADRVEIVDELC